MANNRQNPNRIRPADSGDTATAANTNFSPKMLIIGVAALVVTMVVFLGVLITGIARFSGEENNHDISYDRYWQSELYAGAFSLTNEFGYYNFWLNPLATNEDDILVYRGDNRVEGCERALTTDFIEAGYGDKGPLTWGTDTIEREGRVVHTFEKVLTCATWVNGKETFLIYPGNSTASLNGNGKAASDIHFIVKNIVGNTAVVEAAATNLCNQPFGQRVMAGNEWVTVAAYQNYELQADKNQADQLEWQYLPVVNGNAYDLDRQIEFGNARSYRVRLKERSATPLPAYFRYVPAGNCR